MADGGNGRTEDITIEILRGIRVEVKSIHDEVKETNHRLDHTNQQLDSSFE